jgi:nucleotide-binding universal stress UspA family protein
VTNDAKPVLLAYDGSESSATAIAVAGRLLAGRRAIVCNASNDSAEGERVAAEGAELARQAGFEASAVTERRHGKAWRALLDVAAREDPAVIVAGAHGLSGVGRPFTTSVEGAAGPLLLCYDGSEYAKRAVSAAAGFFAERRAIVFHTWESWMAEAPALAGASASVQGMAAELDEVVDEQSADRAAEGVAVAEGAGFDAEGLSERATGPTWKTVLDAADQHSCAAIVVGSRGLTGISAALGSVSNGVVHHSRRPVLVVPPEEER